MPSPATPTTPPVSVADSRCLSSFGITADWTVLLTESLSAVVDSSDLALHHLSALRREGTLVPVLADLHLPPSRMQDRDARVSLVARATPPGSVVTREAAAWIWGGPVMTRVTAAVGKGVTVYRPHPAAEVIQSSRIPEEDILILEVPDAAGQPTLQVASPTWAALDLLLRCITPHRSPEAALSAARDDVWLRWLLDGPTSLAEVSQRLDVLTRFPKVRALRDLVGQLTG